MKQEDRHKTAFSTQMGQYQWVSMPFGLKTAGAVFSRMMRKLLEPLKRSKIDNLMDDTLIATETLEEHVTELSAVLF